MKKSITTKFLENRDDTGRYIVVDIRSGRKFFVEPISNQRDGDWGSYNPGTGNIEKYLRYKRDIMQCSSMGNLNGIVKSLCEEICQ